MLWLKRVLMCQCGDEGGVVLPLSVVLVHMFVGEWDPLCALEACMDDFQVAASESELLADRDPSSLCVRAWKMSVLSP